MSGFAKTRGCPASHELADYAAGVISNGNGHHISDHLSRCEFCDLEAELYARFEPLAEPVRTPPIPKALMQLARSIFRRNRRRRSLRSHVQVVHDRYIA